MMRRLPPWGAIEAFVVTARAEGFKEVAARLDLSAPTPTLTLAGERYFSTMAD